MKQIKCEHIESGKGRPVAVLPIGDNTTVLICWECEHVITGIYLRGIMVQAAKQVLVEKIGHPETLRTIVAEASDKNADLLNVQEVIPT